MKDLDERRKSKFFFKRSPSMLKAKVDNKRDDILINYTTEETMLMNEFTSLPWYRAQEKDARFYQFIEGTPLKGQQTTKIWF